jgi:hypothetical protein
MCDLTRARLRRGLWEARVCTRRGHIPVVLRVSSTEVGQRVRLWMRPGTALEQLGREDDRNVKLGVIRAALMAREVRVSRSPRFASLVTVEVIRRDPLGRRNKPLKRPGFCRDSVHWVPASIGGRC